jgi:cathepsin A (carboxypeptidase C)
MLFTAALLPLIPLIAAFHLPPFPSSPQQAVSAANALLHGTPSTLLSAASDISLADLKNNDEFVTLTSASHPGHSVRIKETTGWCDPDVRSYTG